jgi:hypothetical protein
MNIRNFVSASLLAVAAAGTAAGPTEVAGAAPDKASTVAVKVKGSVERGAHKAASGVGHGAAVAARAIDNTARKLGLPVFGPPAPAPATR